MHAVFNDLIVGKGYDSKLSKSTDARPITGLPFKVCEVTDCPYEYPNSFTNCYHTVNN